MHETASETTRAGGSPANASERARRFMDALQRAEETGDPAPLVALFHPDAEIESILLGRPVTGRDGARRFWSTYLRSFRDVRSRFDRVSEADRLIVLEWTTGGTLASGAEIEYRGVSILEHDGDAVRRFRTYYDSAALEGGRRPH